MMPTMAKNNEIKKTKIRISLPKFLKAARCGDVNNLKMAIEYGADINYRNTNGRTRVLEASMQDMQLA